MKTKLVCPKCSAKEEQEIPNGKGPGEYTCKRCHNKIWATGCCVFCDFSDPSKKVKCGFGRLNSGS